MASFRTSSSSQSSLLWRGLLSETSFSRKAAWLEKTCKFKCPALSGLLELVRQTAPLCGPYSRRGQVNSRFDRAARQFPLCWRQAFDETALRCLSHERVEEGSEHVPLSGSFLRVRSSRLGDWD
jgi:hypothetical protein